MKLTKIMEEDILATFKQRAFLKCHWDRVTDDGRKWFNSEPTKENASILIGAILEDFAEERKRRKSEGGQGEFNFESGEDN